MLAFAVAAVLLALPPSTDGLLGTAAGVTREEVAAHIRFLSDDLLEGRGIGARGGALAERYVEAMFRIFGLEPAFGDSYLQPLALRGVDPDDGMTLELSGAGVTAALEYGEDFVAVCPFPAGEHRFESELLYLGYGIASERWGWDDYKDVEVRGRILVMHVNEPRPDLPELFEGRALTYYGRWTYKFREAARRGAAGVLLIHSTEDAGYDWTVVRNSWGGEAIFDPDAPEVLPLQGWIGGGAAERLFALAGLDPAALRSAAQERSFRPVPLGVTARFAARNSYRDVHVNNVAGLVRGRVPGAGAIVVSAHLDHLGMGNAVDGDGIYNGAIDNGSAVATLLALARVFGAHPGTLDCDVVFLACAAEEEGLIGSSYFARHPHLPGGRLVANVNFEMTNVWGETSDLLAIGARHSDLGDLVAGLAGRHGMTVSPDRAPEQGYFYRSDQFSFARAGVPAVWFDCGETVVARPPGWGSERRRQYRARSYHRPSDQFDPEWELAGTLQLIRLAAELLIEIDRRAESLGWKPDSPFGR